MECALTLEREACIGGVVLRGERLQLSEAVLQVDSLCLIILLGIKKHLDVSPGAGTRHLEGPKNLYGLNLGVYVFVFVYKVHMCIYMLGGGMRS